MSERIILIYGKTGTGKTTLIKLIAKQFPLKKKIVIDTLDEYEGFLISNNFVDTAEFIKKNDEYNISCRFESDKDLEYLFHLLKYERDILLICEESSAYLSPNVKDSYFLDLIKFGRHWNINIIAASRTVSEISPQVRANVNTIYSFKQTSPNDLKVMQSHGLIDLDKLEIFDYKKYSGVPVEDLHYKKIIF